MNKYLILEIGKVEEDKIVDLVQKIIADLDVEERIHIVQQLIRKKRFQSTLSARNPQKLIEKEILRIKHQHQQILKRVFILYEITKDEDYPNKERELLTRIYEKTDTILISRGIEIVDSFSEVKGKLNNFPE